MKNCNEINELMTLYIDNMLDESQRAQFDEHISGCEACSRELMETATIVQYCKEISDEELPEGFKESLHKRLTETQEMQENHHKSTIKIRNRYIGVLSSIAAGLLVLVFLRGFMGSQYMGKTGSTAMEAPKMEAAVSARDIIEEPGKAEEKNEADAGVLADNASGSTALSMEEPKASEDVSALKIKGTAPRALKSEVQQQDTASEKKADSQALLSRGDYNKESVLTNRSTGLEIYSENPGDELGTVKDCILAYGGIINEKPVVFGDGSMEVRAADSDSQVILEARIPNSQYSQFEEAIRKRFSNQQIEFSAMKIDDVTQRIKELNQVNNELDNNIKSVEKEENGSSREGLEQTKAEQAKVLEEIEKLVRDSDYIIITITIKKK